MGAILNLEVINVISFLSKGMALILVKHNIIDDETCEVCQYGFEIIVSTCIGAFLVLLIGIVTQELIASVLFYSIFVGIRLFTGGYHASTHFKCKCLLCCSCLFVIIMAKFFKDIYSFYLQEIIVILYLFSVFLYAPIEHRYAPMTEETKIANRKRAIVISMIIAVAQVPAYYLNKKISLIIAFSLFIVAFLMVVSKIERRESNEQRLEKDS